jgi:hypothetical protein
MRALIRPISLVLTLCSLFAFSVFAETLELREDAPQEYVVKKGDTLWDLASLYLNDPWLWPRLWQMNPQVENPNLIYPGDTIRLMYTPEGEPVLVMGKKVLKLSPQKRISRKKSEAIPVLPLNKIAPYLSYEQALDEEVIESLPYVLGADRSIKRALPGDLLYVKGDLKSNRKFAIYRKGKEYIDPETEDSLGYEAVLVGVADLLNSGNPAEGVPAKVRIATAKQEVRASDVLMPIREGQDLPAFFKMRPLENQLEGSIIATPTNVAGVSKYEVVVINKGFINDVAPGHIMDISRKSPAVVDQGLGPKYQDEATRYEKFVGNVKNLFQSESDKGVYDMPYESVGQVMLFKVYERVSYGIVTRNTEAIQVGDRISTVAIN